MNNRYQVHCFCVAALALAALFPPIVSAQPDGISCVSGNPDAGLARTCILCHDGGIEPSVSFVGPDQLAPGARGVFTVTVQGHDPTHVVTGIDVSAEASAAGRQLGVFDTNAHPQLALAAGSCWSALDEELVHRSPIPLNPDGSLSFSFAWTAPSVEELSGDSVVTVYAAVLAANSDNTQWGDQTLATTLDVSIASDALPLADPGGAYVARLGRELVLDGSGSSGQVGTSIVSYSWNFGDGSGTIVSTEPKIGHTYDALGTFGVTLTVIDSGGNVSPAAATTVTVAESLIPIADPGGPYEGKSDRPVSFDASASYGRNGASVASYAWDFGDGSATITTADPVIGHTYSGRGDYTVTLIVTDNFADASDPATTTATIKGKRAK